VTTTIENPYKVLGVKPTATDAEIKKAFRKLVKKLHPDINPGNAKNEDRFKAVSVAHDVLGDTEKRRKFDAGEIDASGAEMPDRTYSRNYAQPGAQNRYEPQGGFDDMGDIFSQAFGHRNRGGGAGMRMRGGDLRFHLTVPFLDAINGTQQRVTMADGKSLEITIPAGIHDGQSLRLAGRGQPGYNGGPPGDALVEISIAPHAVFQREGDDILIEVPISIDEAILGASVQVPTATGAVKVKVPAGSSSGRSLRLKGKGAAKGRGKGAGDQLVTLKIVVPSKPDATLGEAMENLRDAGGYQPRAGWKGQS